MRKELRWQINTKAVEGFEPTPWAYELTLYRVELHGHGFIGMAGFEPTVSCSQYFQNKRVTDLRYTPQIIHHAVFEYFLAILK